MPWQLDLKAPKMERNNETLVCYDLFSPATFIVLNPDSGIAEISFNQVLGNDTVSLKLTKSASLAIASIKSLNIPHEIKQESFFLHKEYKIDNYRENLPKITIYLDPDNKNGLAALLDDIGAFDPPAPPAAHVLPSKTAATRSKPSTPSKSVTFELTVNSYSPNCDPKKGLIVMKDKEAIALKPPRTESRKTLKHSSHYSRNEASLAQEEPVKAPPIEPTNATKKKSKHNPS